MYRQQLRTLLPTILHQQHQVIMKSPFIGPLGQGYTVSRSCRGQRQHCVPLSRGHTLVRNCRELLLWFFGAWSGKEVGTCPLWSDRKPYLQLDIFAMLAQMLLDCFCLVLQSRPSWGAQSRAAGCPCQLCQLVRAMQNMMHFEGGESLVWGGMHVLVTELAMASECSRA